MATFNDTNNPMTDDAMSSRRSSQASAVSEAPKVGLTYLPTYQDTGQSASRYRPSDTFQPQYQRLGGAYQHLGYGPLKGDETSLALCPGVENLPLSRDERQDQMSGTRADVAQGTKSYDHSIFQRHPDGALPYGHGWYGTPFYMPYGHCCYPGMSQVPCMHSTIPRPIDTCQYSLGPSTSSDASFARSVDPSQVFSQPSPVPTLSDCTTQSGSSVDLNMSFATTQYRYGQGTKHGTPEEHSRADSPKEYGPLIEVHRRSESAPDLEYETQGGSAHPRGYWDHQGAGARPTRNTSQLQRVVDYGHNLPSLHAFASQQNSSRPTFMPPSAMSFDRGSLSSYSTTCSERLAISQETDNQSSSYSSHAVGEQNSRPNAAPANESADKWASFKSQSKDKQKAPARSLAARKSHYRRSQHKDDFLVRSKMKGMTYKQIKEKGNFAEAESTLRGRFRTLTKVKEKRVRRPRWSEHDVSLLREAVSRLGAIEEVGDGDAHDETRGSKVSWRQVADYIAVHGGSYHFGTGTCRKKWDEVNEG